MCKITLNSKKISKDLIDKGIKTKYPMVVVDDKNRMLGIIVRTSILTGLLKNGE